MLLLICDDTSCKQKIKKIDNKFNQSEEVYSSFDKGDGCNALLSKSLIDNSKQFRMENNKQNVKIIGNNNRIKISVNFGNIQIIGNSNKLKINMNYGLIQYVGNNGRISLGKDSEEQFVNYIGCNGTLKIFDSSKADVSKGNSSPTETNVSGFSYNNYLEKYANLKVTPKNISIMSENDSIFQKTSKSQLCNNLKLNLNNHREKKLVYQNNLPKLEKVSNILTSSNNFDNIMLSNKSNITYFDMYNKGTQ